jgi:hypothetical protein
MPAGYAPLLPRGRWIDIADLGDLLRLVAEQTGLDRAGARRALEATLETLAERIDGGEVDPGIGIASRRTVPSARSYARERFASTRST